MKAIVQTNPNDPRALELQEVPDPELRPGEVLVRTKASGVNRADLLQARGHYPTPPGTSEIMGLECAGVIVDPGDTDREAGEAVGCLLAGGGYAELVAVPEGQLAPLPEGWGYRDGGSVIEVACTVWNNLGMIAGVHPGQRVLLHGGSGGIGSFAIQLCKQLGAEVAVTAGSPEKLEYCRQLGADIAINYREQDFAAELKGSVDVILDVVGAKYLDANLKTLAKDGQLIIIGMQGGTKADVNIARLLPNRLTVRGTTLRARSINDKAAIVASTVEHVWPMLADGRITHHVHEEFPLADAAAAHATLDSGAVTGKIVLLP